MGPTNLALVKLFKADQELRGAQERYESAARGVRLLERKVADLSAKLAALQKALKEQQTKSSGLDLDLQTRDAHIEKLRTQQQQAKTNKEYQVFLTEINVEKADRNKIEDELMGAMEVVERTQGEVKVLQAQLDEEQKKLTDVKTQLGGKLAELQAEIDKLKPARDAAYEATPARARGEFERLAERHEGEAMSALEKPDRRNEEYVCGACQMALVVDVYNRLHSRDDLVSCSSCGRMLYIPADLPPDVAVHKIKPEKEPKEPKAPRAPKEKKISKSEKGIGAPINRQSSAEAVVNSVTIEEDPAPSTESGEVAPATSVNGDQQGQGPAEG
jgi:predicted  nucleic acid-binding Zn-ribbon protein